LVKVFQKAPLLPKEKQHADGKQPPTWNHEETKPVQFKSPIGEGEVRKDEERLEDEPKDTEETSFSSSPA
jgi:hypothetical protein